RARRVEPVTGLAARGGREPGRAEPRVRMGHSLRGPAGGHRRGAVVHPRGTPRRARWSPRRGRRGRPRHVPHESRAPPRPTPPPIGGHTRGGTVLVSRARIPFILVVVAVLAGAFVVERDCAPESPEPPTSETWRAAPL